jgi:hypothetical protein
MSGSQIEFHVPSLDLTIRATLLADENPDTVATVRSQLPLRSILGHAVIAGSAVLIPARPLHRGGTYMKPRELGTVYHYLPGQAIFLTYGPIAESALVNKFAEVRPEDFGALARLGVHVHEKTILSPVHHVIEIVVREVD